MKPGLPQGTRDFDAVILRKRQYIFQTIREEFELHGYQPLETPAFENLETLMGKYGDEGDKLIFKILNNGLENPDKQEKIRKGMEEVTRGRNSTAITERALKYDLTIPFARYVAMNSGTILLPYKRYQIQPVWRADRPQRGRYREFYQCDADIIGSSSLLNEVELIQIYKNVFRKLKIEVQICINNRKILSALAQRCGGEEWLIPITVAIDKLDKIGLEKVMDELSMKGLPPEHQQTVRDYLHLSSANLSSPELMNQLHVFFDGVEEGMKGLQELNYVMKYHHDITLDVSLARGLNYYTGTILEVKPLGIQMGSIGGGGRYDNLTDLFGVKGISGVGISFGVDRIYDVMDELHCFPDNLNRSLRCMLVNFGEAYEVRNMDILKALREKNISCELYPDATKFDKQLKYANRRGVDFVLMVGEDEFKEEVISVKNFVSGEQKKMSLAELLDKL